MPTPIPIALANGITARLPDTNLTRNKPPISKEKDMKRNSNIIILNHSPAEDSNNIIPAVIKRSENPRI